MRASYLYEHTAQILQTAVHVYAWSKEEPLRFLHRYAIDEMEVPPLSCEIEQEISAARPQTFPQLFSVGRRIYYALVFTENELSLVGPVRLAAPIHLFRDIPDGNDGTAGQTRQLPPCDVPIFFQSVLLLHNICHDIPVSQHELLMANCSTKNLDEVLQDSTKLVFDNRELGKRHNSYQQEQRLMESIEQGDMQMLQTCRQDNVLADDFGKLAPEMDRSIRNVCNSVITLASRAAIRGGVHPELAFSLCDTYITKIEEISDLFQVQVVVEGAEAHFTRMVNALRKTPLPREDSLRHPLVEKSKDYIYSHLHGKIVLNDVAALLGTNPSYLSELFKHYEGQPFSDFVMREKVNLAKSLLLYSSASYSEIAANLGFSSQSHLGKHFKAITGLTLMQFRNQFSMTDTVWPDS